MPLRGGVRGSSWHLRARVCSGPFMGSSRARGRSGWWRRFGQWLPHGDGGNKPLSSPGRSNADRDNVSRQRRRSSVRSPNCPRCAKRLNYEGFSGCPGRPDYRALHDPVVGRPSVAWVSPARRPFVRGDSGRSGRPWDSCCPGPAALCSVSFEYISFKKLRMAGAERVASRSSVCLLPHAGSAAPSQAPMASVPHRLGDTAR